MYGTNFTLGTKVLWEVSLDGKYWMPATYLGKGPKEKGDPDIWRTAIVRGHVTEVKFWRKPKRKPARENPRRSNPGWTLPGGPGGCLSPSDT